MSHEDPLFVGFCRGGHFHPDQPTEVKRHCQELDGERVEVRISKFENSRSARANRYLWLVYGYIARDQEETPLRVHAFMKERFLDTAEVALKSRQTGEMEERTVRGSTAVLKSGDFYRYVENVRLFAAEWLGLEIPDPEPGLLVREKKSRAA